MKLAQLVAIAAIASMLTQASVFAEESPTSIAPVADKSAEVAPSSAQPTEIAPAADKSAEVAPGSVQPTELSPAAEKSANPAAIVVPAPEKKYSFGPVIEFGASTAFGITSKFSVSDQISVRPMILFGYKPSVSRSNINNIGLKAGATQTQIDTSAGQQFITDLLSNTGTGYGLAVTYDFKLPDSKIVGYIGPRVLFGSSSGSGTSLTGAYTISTNETNVGLTAGADYAISPDVTAGLSATYNVLRSGTTSVTTAGQTLSEAISGGNFNVGINVMYNF
jgi:opacity protein-like surface antigen